MFAVSCSSAEEGQSRPPSAAGAGLPRLEEVTLYVDAAHAPEQDVAPLAVTLRGTVTYVQSRGRYVTVDSMGRVTAEFGLLGEGPGESRGGMPIGGDSVVAIISATPPSILTFTPEGRLLSEYRSPGLIDGMRQQLVGDSIDRSFSQRLVGRSSILEDVQGPITRTCITGGCERELMAADDSILRLVMTAAPRKDGVRWPPYAAEPGRFVLGDGVDYRLWAFDDGGKLLYAFGRIVEPRRLTPRELAFEEVHWKARIAQGVPLDLKQMREDVMKERIPHFSHGSMGFDERRRLWVTGKVNDSTFADIFADSVFLGRIMLPCVRERGTVGIRGHWMALLCENEGNDSIPFIVRLFRIVETL
jgi:hypothetical protein